MGILSVKTVALFLCFAAALHQGCGQFGNIAAPNRNFYYRGAQWVRLPVTQYRPLVPQYFRGSFPLPRLVQAQAQTRRVSPIRQFLELWAWNRVLNPPTTAPPPTTEMPTTPTTIPPTSVVTTSTAATTEATTTSTTSTTAGPTERPLCNDLNGQSVSGVYIDLTARISSDLSATTASSVCINDQFLMAVLSQNALNELIDYIRSVCEGTSAILWTGTSKITIDGMGGGNAVWYGSVPPTTNPQDSNQIHRLRVDSAGAGFLPDEDGATADGSLCEDQGI